MKHLPTIIWATGLVVSVWVGAEAYKAERALHERAETDRAQYYAKAAEWNASTARFEAIKASVELEAKRTTVERTVRDMVLAEMRKCKKGSCK